MLKKVTFAIFILPFVLGLFPLQTAYATEAILDTSSCLNPQMSMTQENVGTDHGVVNVGSFPGTDTIYQSGNNRLQCLCTDEGQGYETKWLDTSELSQEDIDNYQKNGWTLIPSGKLWGLKDCAYLAKNENFTCLGKGGLGGGTTSSSSENQNNNSSNSNSSTSNGGPEKSVLALANTGNSSLIVALLLAGFLSLFAGIKAAQKSLKA